MDALPTDLKSFGAMHRVGSTPTPGTIVFSKIRPALTLPLLILVSRTFLFAI